MEFDTTGGDAWTFDKHVEGRVDPATCDEVSIHGPTGSSVAAIHDRRFWASVPLRSGENEIWARCTRQGREVARSPAQHWLMRIEDRPRAWIRTRIDGRNISMDAGGSEMAAGVAAPLTRFEWRARRGNPAPLTLTPVTAPTLRVESPDRDGEYYVTLRVTDALGRSDESTAVFHVVSGSPKEVDLERDHPAWISRSVLYGVAPFAFGHNGYDDVRKRLPEIAALGVTAIWLSPVTGAPHDDFGYAVTDHFQTRREFGTTLQLKALIEAAHAHGLRVLIDFVPNHLAASHRYYVDAERSRQRSPYFDWFERDPQGRATSYFDWSHLKNLEYDNPEVQRYMIEAFSYWVRELNVDGFRVDVSWGIRERAPEFWPRWRKELKRIDPDVLLIAEASALDGYYFQHGFDAAYDWTAKLGEWAWNEAFAGATPDLARLRAALLKSSRDLPEPGIVLRFLNNNDTGERFITRHGPDLTRVAATMLLTLPGLPLIYNGDEVGAEFLPYDEQPLSWNDRHGLLAHYTRLVQLRKELPALSSPKMELVATNRDDAVLAYMRRPAAEAPCDQSVLVLLNFSNQPVDLKLTAAGAESLQLKPFDARVLPGADCNQ
ncbi:alpha-amylase family glycosyl hydrolase [Steroidobacter flavus]|uniref:Alpha-amylase family glycosyl hydrolase n=1 Tax=Steroidobacter flavus TaxID=1842136 RepID=A0ABV8SUY3_9GAMM